jgi:hypothetical protein
MGKPAEVTPEFYREQARRVRELAGKMTQPEIKDQLEGVAVQYEQMAEYAGWLPPKRPPAHLS